MADERSPPPDSGGAPGARDARDARSWRERHPKPPAPPPPPPVWVCTQHTLRCRHEHPFLRARDTSMNVQTRVDGHVYMECPTCDPKTYAFGVAATRPAVLVTFYACTPDQYRHILEMPDDADTPDVLRYLGYLPRL